MSLDNQFNSWSRPDNGWITRRGSIYSLLVAVLLLFLLTGATVYANRLVKFGMTVQIPLGIFGVVATLAALYLWGAMWVYWLRVDDQPKIMRAFWFALLAFGMSYGAAFYFFLVYWPAYIKAKRMAAR